MKKLIFTLGVGAVVSMPAHALVANNLLSMQDDDIDYVLRSDGEGGYSAVTDGAIQRGDVFFSVFEFPTVTLNGTSIIGPNEEFTGVAAVQLIDITNPDGSHPADGFGAVVGSIYDFGVWTDFNTFLTGQGGQSIAPYDGGAAVALWRNSTLDFNLDLDRAHNGGNPNCVNLADCIQKAATGSLFQVDGFLNDGDELWKATQVVGGGGNLTTVKNLNNTTQIVSVNFALSNIFQAGFGGLVGGIDTLSGTPCNFTLGPADGCAQVTGNVNLTGGQGIAGGNEAVAHSTTINAQKYVPEPATLALFGIGLLGFGARARRSL